MGQTDSQFKAFIRFILDALKAVEEETDEEKRAAKAAPFLYQYPSKQRRSWMSVV